MSEHCMNGPAKAHTLHMVGIIKALKTAAASGRLPVDIDPVRYVRLARAIADHWPSDLNRPPAPSLDTAPDDYERERDLLAKAIHKKVNSSSIARTVPYLVGDAERAVAAVLEQGWTPPTGYAHDARPVTVPPLERCPECDVLNSHRVSCSAAPDAATAGEPRVFPPDSPQPDDVTFVEASNGVRFQALGDASPLRSWQALEDHGGDGHLYTWWRMNASNSPDGPLTLTEVHPADPGEA